MQFQRDQILAKIKGDAGIYSVWAIDWLNLKVQVYRATVYEWVDMKKVKLSFYPCLLCSCFKDYTESKERYPENCSTWLCGDGRCPYEKDAVTDNKAFAPDPKGRAENAVANN